MIDGFVSEPGTGNLMSCVSSGFAWLIPQTGAAHLLKQRFDPCERPGRCGFGVFLNSYRLV